MYPHLIDSPGVFGTEILHFFFFYFMLSCKDESFRSVPVKILNPEGTLANNF